MERTAYPVLGEGDFPSRPAAYAGAMASSSDDPTTTSGTGDVHRSLELLWDGGGQPSRGPRRGLTLDRITAAAVALADTEGLGAVSMRRLATELGVGTMTLYRYVPGKAELLDLMLDRVHGEPSPRPPAPRPRTGATVSRRWPAAIWT